MLGLNDILEGGLPRGSRMIINGVPDLGKTLLELIWQLLNG